LAVPGRQCEIPRGAWNEDLFRVLESFPDLAHDDEVDTCSGALEILNTPIKGWAILEYYRLTAQELAQQRKLQPAPPANPALAPWNGKPSRTNQPESQRLLPGSLMADLLGICLRRRLACLAGLARNGEACGCVASDGSVR
jgi:hypothetical protein